MCRFYKGCVSFTKEGRRGTSNVDPPPQNRAESREVRQTPGECGERRSDGRASPNARRRGIVFLLCPFLTQLTQITLIRIIPFCLAAQAPAMDRFAIYRVFQADVPFDGFSFEIYGCRMLTTGPDVSTGGEHLTRWA